MKVFVYCTRHVAFDYVAPIERIDTMDRGIQAQNWANAARIFAFGGTSHPESRVIWIDVPKIEYANLYNRDHGHVLYTDLAGEHTQQLYVPIMPGDMFRDGAYSFTGRLDNATGTVAYSVGKSCVVRVELDSEGRGLCMTNELVTPVLVTTRFSIALHAVAMGFAGSWEGTCDYFIRY